MIKAAILIDGGYFLKRLPAVRPDIDVTDPEDVAAAVNQLVLGHLNQLNSVYKLPNCFQLLYRTFYYDAQPYEGKEHTPVDKRAINYSKTGEAAFRKGLFRALRSSPNLAVRLGEVLRGIPFWTLKPESQRKLLG